MPVARAAGRSCRPEPNRTLGSAGGSDDTAEALGTWDSPEPRDACGGFVICENESLKPGDVVNISPEVKHWHGAAADSWFQHIAIAMPAEDASAEWLEPVTDEEYGKLM